MGFSPLNQMCEFNTCIWDYIYFLVLLNSCQEMLLNYWYYIVYKLSLAIGVKKGHVLGF